MKKLILLLSIAGFSGCGLHDLGVLSVSFDLTAVEVEAAPEGLDVEFPEAVHEATGTVNVDVHEDDLHIAVHGLPELPEGFAYMAMGSFAEHARGALPGVEEEVEAGHGHGASTFGTAASATASAGEGEHDDEEELTTMTLGELEPGAEDGEWEIELSSGDLGDDEIAAIRAAMVMLVSEMGDITPLLQGEVGAEDASGSESAEGEGHSHGP